MLSLDRLSEPPTKSEQLLLAAVRLLRSPHVIMPHACKIWFAVRASGTSAPHRCPLWSGQGTYGARGTYAGEPARRQLSRSPDARARALAAYARLPAAARRSRIGLSAAK